MDVKGIIQFTLWDRGLGVFFPQQLTPPSDGQNCYCNCQFFFGLREKLFFSNNAAHSLCTAYGTVVDSLESAGLVLSHSQQPCTKTLL